MRSLLPQAFRRALTYSTPASATIQQNPNRVSPSEVRCLEHLPFLPCLSRVGGRVAAKPFRATLLG